MADFATISDLEAGWRPLSASERIRAAGLLAKASRTIRADAPGIDARIAADTLDAALVGDIACDLVRRILTVPTDQQPATQASQSAGPFSASITFANPTGDMYLTKAERRRLGISRQRAGFVDMGPQVPAS